MVVPLHRKSAPSFRGHSTYRRGLPRRRGADAPHRLWIGVLRGREVSGSTRVRFRGRIRVRGRVRDRVGLAHNR